MVIDHMLHCVAATTTDANDLYNRMLGLVIN
jgi:hypothetical protein